MSVDKMTKEMKPRNLYRLTTIDTLSADEMSVDKMTMECLYTK